MSNGNGAREVALEVVCPIDASVRPGECRSIYAQLEDIRKTQRDHGRGLVRLGREVAGAMAVLQEVAEQLGKLIAAHGGKPAKRRKGQ